MEDLPLRVLLVDDDEDDYLVTRDLLREIGRNRFQLEWVPSFERALQVMSEREFGLHLLDYSLGKHNGLELLRAAQERGCSAPTILLTGRDDRETDVAAMKAGAADFLVKGRIDSSVLDRSIRYTLERARAQDDLRKAKEAAESASRAKSQFLANMSHEIRTPMTGVMGMLDLVLDTELSRDQRDYLQTARYSAQSLLFLLNDILDFSKVEAGRIEFVPVVFSLLRCLEDAVRPFGVQAQEKGLDLTYEAAADVPDLLVGDPVRLRQVVVNLVGNALKFTEAGGVSVRVTSDSLTSSEAVLHIQVADTGIGIPQEKQTLIFDAFRQADDSMARRYGGTGLGLTISARLVELMRGRIWVESEVGRGSTFHFTAALTRPAAGQRLETVENGSLQRLGQVVDSSPRQSPTLRVLLAEDNLVNRKLVTALLRKHGYEPTVVENGREAVRAVETQPFDLILMDVQMPEMDGLEATAAIRKIEAGTDRHTPVVAMTACAMRSDRETCMRAGMDDYISKPINVNELSRTLERWSRRDVTEVAASIAPIDA